MAEKSYNDDPDELDTYASNYSVFTSDTEQIDSPSVPDKYHHNFISFVSLAHQLEIDFMDVTWQPALHLLGVGGSSQIHVSNLVTKQLTFAFKSTIPRRGRPQLSLMGADRQRFRSLVCEVLVLCHPEVRNHPNITKLLGISWDFRNNSVWPVLIFPKADEGSLEDFIHGSKGTNASLEDLIRICADIALGLDSLHRNNIVHGDLNPRNILISRENGAYVAKITDFESSCICASEEDFVSLPKTIPWDAPEWRDRWVTCRDAKGVDVYAFGLICFFTIFQSFTSVKVVDVLPELKANGRIMLEVDALLENFEISPLQRRCMFQFFERTLSQDPKARETDFENLIRLLSFDEDFILLAKRKGAEVVISLPEPHNLTTVTTEFVHLGRCDYRVRIFLCESLKCAAKDTTCKVCASQAAFSLAVGFKTCFFIPRDEHLVDQYLIQSGHSSVELEEGTTQIQENVNPPTRISRAIKDYQAIWHSAVVDIYKTDRVLTLAEAHLRQEVQARGGVLGKDHILTREAKLQLSSILQDMGHLSEATRLFEQVQQSYIVLEIDDTVILRQLAILYANRGLWTQAEALLTTVINKTEHAFDKVKDQVNERIAINEGLKQKYEGKAEAKTIAEMGEVLKNMRQECGERNILLLQMRMEMGSIYHGQGKFGLAVDTMRKVVEGFREQLGPDHLTTISAMESLAGSLVMQGALLEALETGVLVVARIGRLVGENHRLLLQSELLVAKIQSYLGFSEKPLMIFKSVIERQTKALSISHLDTLISEKALVRHHMDRQEYDSALSVQEGVVQKSETSLGARHPFTIQSRKLLGQLLENMGKIDRAIELLSAAVEGNHEILGESHPDTVSARVALCSALRAKGELQEAENMCAKSLEILEHMYGKNHPVTLAALASLAAIRSDQDKQDEASELLRRAIAISDNTTGQDSHETVHLLSMLAKTATDVKELQELRTRISGSERRRLESAKKATVTDGNQRAISLVSQKRWKEALDILTEVLPLSKEIFGQKEEMTMNILGNVAVCHIGLGGLSSAKETIEDVLRTLRENMPEDSPAVLNQRANLASVLMRMGRLEEARSLNESLLTTMRIKYGETHPDTLRIMNNLAATNSRQDSTQSEAHALLYRLTQAMEELAARDDAAA